MQTIERTFPREFAAKLVQAGYSPLIAKLLASRGVRSAEGAGNELSQLLPYDRLKNAIAMAETFADSIEEGLHHVIVADYDADGATACAIGIRALQAFGANVTYLVPNRLIQGYGLTRSIVEDVSNLIPKPDIIITVDNGIASHEGITYANSLGIRVLVTDHHLPAASLPDAELIVNPSQPGCPFPSKALAGCGVIYYVMEALEEVLTLRNIPKKNSDFMVNDLLPIVAIGTVADVVPLDANNRILVHQGLSLIKSGKAQPGINALISIAGKIKENLSTSDIAFAIGPRINAAGRLQSMDAGIECLITNDLATADALALDLNDINNNRKEIEGDITDEATNRLLTDVLPSHYTAVLFAKDWHHGVIGVVAGRIKERIWRPTFVLAEGHEGELRGSGRSIPGFHLRDALDLVSKRAPGLLLKFGGHAMAAGVSIKPDGLMEFIDLFEAVARELITPAILNQIIEVDGSLTNDELTLASVTMIRSQIWGQQFPEPLFRDTFEVIESREIGGGKHLKLTLRKDGKIFNAVKFRHLDGRPPQWILANYRMDANTFKEVTNLQLLIENYEDVT